MNETTKNLQNLQSWLSFYETNRLYKEAGITRTQIFNFKRKNGIK